MPAPVTQAQLPLLFRSDLRSDFRDDFMEWTENFSTFLKYGTTSEVEVAAALITGPNRFSEMFDGEAPVLDDLVMSDKVAATDKEFGRGFSVTRKTVEDDKHNKAKSGAKWLAHAARMTMELRGAQVLDDFFSGTTFKGYDGLSFGNSAHPALKGSSTFNNTITTEVSITGFTQMLDKFRKMVDLNGDPTVINPDRLYVPNDEAIIHRATQILQSNAEPFTTENQDNAIKKLYGSRLGTPIPLVYVSSQTNWYMCNWKWNDFHFLMRRSPTTEDFIDPRTKAFVFQSTARWLIWGVDWHGWVGANVT